MAWADRSAFEQACLRYCAPLGIPLSVFKDERVVYPGEPQWLEGDVLAALDWQNHQDQTCDGCGQTLDETFGPAHEEKWNAEMSGHCDGCRALRRAALIAQGSDDPIDPTVGARFRMWRDEEASDGSVELAP